MKHNLWRKFWTLCLGVICSFGVHAQSVLVSGTDFSCAGYENEAYVSVNEITGWLGIIQPQITVNLPPQDGSCPRRSSDRTPSSCRLPGWSCGQLCT